MRIAANNFRWALVTSMCTAALLTGCVGLTASQKTAVGRLGEASAKLGPASSAQLALIRDNVIQMNLEALMLQGPGFPSKPGEPPPSIVPGELDKNLSADVVATIGAATNAITAYGEALVALVDDTQSANVKSAAATFASSLRSVPGSRLTTEQATAIGDAVESVGGFLVEAKRKKAVVTLVLNARSSVDSICALLVTTFDPEADKSAGVVLRSAILSVSIPAHRTFAHANTYQKRKEAELGLKLAFDNEVRRTHDLVKVKQAAKAMKSANDALVAAMQDAKWSMDDVLDFSEKVQSLQDAVHRSMNKGG